MRRERRPWFSASLVVGAIVAALTGAAPAWGTHDTSTASVQPREVLAGRSGVAFSIVVSHPEPDLPLLPPPPVNYVRVRTPAGLVAATGGSASGWQATMTSPEVVLFTGGSIAAGSSETFTVSGNVAASAADACGEWEARVSSDGGTSLEAAIPASAGALTSCVRVLASEDVQILAPAGAADGTVTSGQAGVCARFRVRSAASAALEVAPTLVGGGATAGPALVAGNPPCSGAELGDGKTALQPGAVIDLDQVIAFGQAGNTTLAATATAEGAATPEGLRAELPVTVQPAPTPVSVLGSLTPRILNPAGPQEVSFSVSVLQSAAGAPRLELDPALTTFAFEGFGPVVLVGSAAFAPGQTLALRFEARDVADDLPNGGHEVTLRLTGRDENDSALVIEALPMAEKVRIDRAVPVIMPVLDPGEPWVAGQPPAVADGQPLDLRGDLRDLDDDGELSRCPGCVVERTRLHQYGDLGCTETVGSDLEVTVTNDGGRLSGSYDGNYDPKAKGVRLSVVARDEVGNRNVGISLCLDVDNVKPVLVKAVAVLDKASGRRNRFVVLASEPVAGFSRAFEWVVVDEAGPNPVVDTPASGQTVLRDFSDDPSGTVTYRPLPLVGGRYYDRVGHTVEGGEMPLVDGIAPTAPTIQSVDGRGPTEGRFRFTGNRPEVVVTNPPGQGEHAVRPGYIVRLYEETNGVTGLQTDDDARMCGDIAQGPSVTMQCAFSAAPGIPTTVYALAIDANGNIGDAAQATFVREA